MALYRMDTLLQNARKQKIAIGAFQCWDCLNIQAIARASAKTATPVIFQATSMEYGALDGAQIIADMVKFYIKKYDIDAALHLDHGQSIDEVHECLEAGFSSVMLDASIHPFAENTRLSAEAAAMAHHYNASCEAELGHVGGGDGGDGSETVFTIPEEAAEFIRLTSVDCLAVAVGTVHGDYRGTPHLQLDRLQKIVDATTIPLVLHGGSGTPKELLQQAIAIGINKINICTDINKTFVKAIKETTLTQSLAGYFYRPTVDATAAKVEYLIRLFKREDI